MLFPMAVVRHPRYKCTINHYQPTLPLRNLCSPSALSAVQTLKSNVPRQVPSFCHFDGVCRAILGEKSSCLAPFDIRGEGVEKFYPRLDTLFSNSARI